MGMNNKEVAHLWANFGQERAKGSHFYFEGPRLYSYGPHYLLGKLFPSSDRGEVALINCDGYSATTRKHKSFAVGALCSSEWVVIECPKPEAETADDHAQNMAYLIAEQKIQLAKLPRARANFSLLLDKVADANPGDFKAYVRRFKIKNAPKFPGLTAKEKREYWAKVEIVREEEAQRQARRAEKERAAEAEALEKWRNGENVQNYFYASDIALRLSADGKQIETSRGAKVDTFAGVRLWKAWKAGQSIAGVEVGAYTVKVASAQGVTIGCHYIKAEEINRFFEGTLNIKA